MKLSDYGFELLVPVFRFYGISLCGRSKDHPDEPKVNPYVVNFNKILILIGCCCGTYILIENIRDGQPLGNVIAYLSQRTVIDYLVTINYFDATAKFKNYHQIIAQLCKHIEAIEPPWKRQQFIDRIRRWTKLTVLALIFDSIWYLAALISVILHHNGSNFWTRLAFTSFQIIFVLRAITVSSMGLLLDCLIALICKTTVSIFEILLPSHGEVGSIVDDEIENSSSVIWSHFHSLPSLNRRQRLHRKLSRMVEMIDRSFALPLLLALATEILLVTIYMRGIQLQMNFLTKVTVGIYTLLQVLSFVVKVHYCSAVNNKVASSLITANMLRDKPRSMDYLDYILYLQQQSIQGAAITYGGFFIIRKSCVFTIAGIALTYIVVLLEF